MCVASMVDERNKQSRFASALDARTAIYWYWFFATAAPI